MNSTDKFALVGALSFFFICMAVALIWLKGQAAKSNSYMPPIDTNQSRPLHNVEARQTALPESVLHYGSNNMPKAHTVDCMLETEYKNMVNARIVEDGYRLSVIGSIGKDKMEIYSNDNGDFFVIAKGPDAIDVTEACIVAEGNKWLVMDK